jgi:hypothetical protein
MHKCGISATFLDDFGLLYAMTAIIGFVYIRRVSSGVRCVRIAHKQLKRRDAFNQAHAAEDMEAGIPLNTAAGENAAAAKKARSLLQRGSFFQLNTVMSSFNFG